MAVAYQQETYHPSRHRTIYLLLVNLGRPRSVYLVTKHTPDGETANMLAADSELVARCQGDDTAAYEELVRRHREAVYGVVYAVLGNHDQMVAETFYADHPLGGFVLGPEAVHAIDQQPYLGIALNPDCDLQAYVEIKSRTTTFEVRAGEFEKQPISVFLTVRKYWGGMSDRFVRGLSFACLTSTDTTSQNSISVLPARTSTSPESFRTWELPQKS